jgi:ribosome biogenesis GTPase A
MSEMQSIQWFPGHMAKTRRLISESLSLIDCVAEIIDARVPLSSRNPVLDELCANKPRILLLNKCDLADESETKKWISYFKANGIYALAVDCKSGKGLNMFLPFVKDLLSEKLTRLREKGMVGRTLRIMVAGIPNSGKSTFINSMAGEKRAKTEDRPGVTRGRQWINLGQGVEMLDTPGILWPKFEDEKVGEHLAFTGAIKDDILDKEQLAARLCQTLHSQYESNIVTRYKIKGSLPEDGFEALKLIGKRRGFLVSGGEVDTLRTAIMVLDEFRGGLLGRITLEDCKVEK